MPRHVELLGALWKDLMSIKPAVAEIEIKHIEYTYIVRVHGIAGSEPTVKGTRVLVRAIALHCKASETLK